MALRTKQAAAGHNSPRLHTILQCYSNQNSVLLQKKNMDQWNKIERTQIKPHTGGQLIFHKEGKDIQWGKESLFSKWCWESWPATCKLMKLEHTFTPYTKI